MKGKKTIFEPYFARQNKQVLENTFQKTLELPLEFFEIQISKYQYFLFYIFFKSTKTLFKISTQLKKNIARQPNFRNSGCKLFKTRHRISICLLVFHNFRSEFRKL